MGKADYNQGIKKIFVLDTSVILYDHDAFLNFQEHDVALPIQVLEELDNMKNGNDTRNFEARSFIRLIDNFSGNNLMNEWLPLQGKGKGRLKVVKDKPSDELNAITLFGDDKVDHRILNAALGLQHDYPDKKVVLVSKDICLRLKAKSLQIFAEDYETGKIKNVDQLHSGQSALENIPQTALKQLIKNGILPADKLKAALMNFNQFYILSGKHHAIPAFYHQIKQQFQRVDELGVLIFIQKIRNRLSPFMLCLIRKLNW
jgi:PhoH-like ATPase